MLAIAACVALVLVGCGDDSAGDGSSSVVPRKPEPQIKLSSDPPPKKLIIRDIEEGDGPGAERGDKILVDDIGVYYGNGVEFENTWEAGKPEKYRLGSELIRGWQLGMEGMKVGGRRELVVPGNLGYQEGALIFVIDLRAIE